MRKIILFLLVGFVSFNTKAQVADSSFVKMLEIKSFCFDINMNENIDKNEVFTGEGAVNIIYNKSNTSGNIMTLKYYLPINDKEGILEERRLEDVQYFKTGDKSVNEEGCVVCNKFGDKLFTIFPSKDLGGSVFFIIDPSLWEPKQRNN